MHLREARLCLDCEELHDQPECPVCLSESFAFVTRWLPPRDRRPPTRAAQPSAATPRPTAVARKWIARGLVGAGLLAIGRLMRPDQGANGAPKDPATPPTPSGS